MSTLQDVAKLAGVSTATVSRTLNSPDLVEDLTRSKVLGAIKQTGYTRNETARSLAMSSSRTIGLLTDNFKSQYFGPIMDTVVGILHQYGYYTIVESSGNSPDEVSDMDKQLLGWKCLIRRQVESIVVLNIRVEDEKLNEMFVEFPNTVVIGRQVPTASNHCIMVDQYIGGQLAAKHLIENGHRDIAMISGKKNSHDARRRSQGFIDELTAHDISLPEHRRFEGDFSATSGAQITQNILNSNDKVTAIFAGNDDMASGVINTCHAAGIDIPTQMSVIGFDNSTIATMVYPLLTTISQPLDLVSQSAATLALNLSTRIQRENPLPTPQTNFLPTLIERMSVADIRS